MGWGQGQYPKKFYARNVIKCQDLHGKVTFTNPQLWGGVEVGVGYQKVSMPGIG